MAAGFDAYHKWLAIPPAEQPPNLYRLLALNPFESDPDVIDSAANARMIHLRSLQSGPQAELTQKLLNEIAAARLCLLKPEKKSSYDAALRVQLGRGTGPKPPVPPPPLPQTVSAQAVRSGAVPAEPANTLLDFIEASYEPGPSNAGAALASKGRSTRANKSAWPRFIMVVVPLVGIGLVAAAIAFRNSRNAIAPNTAPNSANASHSANASNAAANKPAAPGKPDHQLSAASAPSLAGRKIENPRIVNNDPPPPAKPIASSSRGNAGATNESTTALNRGGRPISASAINPEVHTRPAPAAGKLRLQYRCMESKSETNQIRCHFRIANDSDDPIPLAALKVRYWFAEAADRPRNFWCDYAAIGKDHVVGRFGRTDPPTQNAAGFLEVGFSDGAGEIKPGADSGEIQCRFAVDDWSNLDQSKDFSFDPTATNWTDNRHIAVFQDGKLVWGQAPLGRK